MTDFSQIVNLPFLYVNGLITTVTGNKTFTIANGQCRDQTNEFDMVSQLNIDVDLTTIGANGLDKGTLANNTSYDVYLIQDAGQFLPIATITTLTGDFPTMPSDAQGNLYNIRRRIGYVLTDGSANLRRIRMFGYNSTKIVQYEAAVVALSAGTAAVFTAVNLKNFMPKVSGLPILLRGSTSAASTAVVRPTGNTLATNAATAPWVIANGGGSLSVPASEFLTGADAINVDEPSLDYMVNAGNVSLTIVGYIDIL